jgi:hypothetical protein
MFGTRRLERFDLHALRQPQSDPVEPSRESQRITVNDALTESGEQPVVRPAALEVAAPPATIAEMPTPISDFTPHAWQEEVPTRPTHDASLVRAPDPDALRTRMTRKFVSLADLVNDAFRGMPLGEAAYRVELTAPQGMSTGGGKQALERLLLHPRRPGFATLLAGTVNLVARQAWLRDYEHIALWHFARFKQPAPVSRQTWEEFIRRAEAVLHDAEIETLRMPPPRELLPQPPRPLPRVWRPAIVALLVVSSLAAIACARVAMVLLTR